MQLACEGHPQIVSVTPGMQFVQNRPSVRPEPVLSPGSDADGIGTIIYGAVIRDGGLFRMWYQAVPADWDGTEDSACVGCVESDDGLVWRRPNYGLREVCGSKNNHLTDLPFHCPSVFIDPGAPDSMRYRAFGWAKPKPDAYRNITQRGYFTAHSADGIHWELDPDKPLYEGHDVITATWHPYTNDALVMMKRLQWVGGLPRRTFRTSRWTRESVTQPVIALVPDEFDDVVAVSRGFNSADYYGAGLLPTPGVTVGFLWHFRHTLPLSAGVNQYGVYGRIDVSLIYQLGHRGKWLHLPGRADWLCGPEMPPWARHGIHTADYPIEVGDQTWFYVTGAWHRHGAYLDTSWKPDPKRTAMLQKKGIGSIGVVTWPTNRLFGFEAPLAETIELSPTEVIGPGDMGKSSSLVLNVTTEQDGGVRVALTDAGGAPLRGYAVEDCDPIIGEHSSAKVTWKGNWEIPDQPIRAKVEITRGTIWAFDFREVS